MRSGNARRFVAWVLVGTVLSACGSGGTGGAPQVVPTVAPSVPSVPSSSAVLSVTSSSGAAATLSAGNTVQTVAFPASQSGSGSLSLTGYAANPVSLPMSLRTHPMNNPRTIKDTSATPIAYVVATPSASMSFSRFPTFTVTLPSTINTAGQSFYVGFYTSDPAFQLTSWREPAFDPATVSGQTLTFPSPAFGTPITLAANQTYNFAIYSRPTVQQALFVSRGDSIAIYPGPNYASATPIVVNPSVSESSHAVDAYGNLFIADTPYLGSLSPAPGTVVMYPAGSYSASSAITITAGVTHPSALILDASRNLYVLNFAPCSSPGSISIYPADNYTTATPVIVPLTGGPAPSAMAVDALGNLFVAYSHFAYGSVSMYYAGSQATRVPLTITAGVGQPTDLALNNNGDLFVTNNYGLGAPSISEFRNGAYTAAPTVIDTGSQLSFTMAFDAHSDLFAVTGAGAYGGGTYGTVYEYPNTNYATNNATSIPIHGGAGNPAASPVGLIALDMLDNLFVGPVANTATWEYPAGGYQTVNPIGLNSFGLLTAYPQTAPQHARVSVLACFGG